MNNKDIIKRWYQYNRKANLKGFDCCTKKELIFFFNNTKKECHYCKIPENFKLHYRFKILQIDRKDNLKGYELENIVFACYRCNTIKSEFLSYNEMLEIGIKYIMPKWSKK